MKIEIKKPLEKLTKKKNNSEFIKLVKSPSKEDIKS